MKNEMDFFHQDLMYEFHAPDMTQTDSLRQIADHAVKEIKSTAGWNTDVEVSIEPIAKDKHLFSVSMTIFGVGEPIIVKKEGKHVLAVLRKVKKIALRQLHRLNKKQAGRRKKPFFKDYFWFREEAV